MQFHESRVYPLAVRAQIRSLVIRAADLAAANFNLHERSLRFDPLIIPVINRCSYSRRLCKRRVGRVSITAVSDNEKLASDLISGAFDNSAM